MPSWEIRGAPQPCLVGALIVTKPVVPCWLRRGGLQCLADVENPLENRENREHRQHVHSWREKVDIQDASPLREHQSYGQNYYPDRSCGQPAFVLDAERFRPCTGVADHERSEDREHAGTDGEVHPLRGE